MGNPFLVKTVKQSAKVVAGTNNIPASFDTSAGSRLLSAITKAQWMCIHNETSSRLAFNYTHSLEGATGAPTAVQGYVPANTSLVVDSVNDLACLFIKSDTGLAITGASEVVTAFVG